MTQIYSNNIASVIGGPLNELVSTITLLAGTGDNFPAPTENEFFLLTLIGIDGEGNEARWEIVKVIERDGDALIVQRGQDNTTAQQWATGTRIELRVTAAGIERGEAAYMWGNHAEQGYLKGQSGDDLFLTKEEADELYLSPEQGDELFLTEAEADELFLTPAEGDVLFLTQDEADALYIPDAPTSGLVYARANGDWVAIDPGEGGVGGSGGAGSINLKYDDITPNGGATYTLAIAGEATESLGATNLLVSVNGTIQESGKAYTTTGTEITFSENLTSEDVVDFVVELTNGSYWTQEGLNLSYDGAGTKVIVDQLEVKDAAQFDADVNVTGNVTAAKFVGDGSGLTGLSAGMVISDDPPENPETGDLWYSSEAGDEGLYSWDGEVWFAAGGPAGSGGGSGAGMVVSATEPTDPIEGMQWLNSDTAEVFIFDGAVWLEFPAGSGGGLWEASGDDIYYEGGKVSIGGDVLLYNVGKEDRGLKITGDNSLGFDGSTWTFDATADNTGSALKFKTRSGEAMCIDSNSNVGIGAEPSSQLHISNNEITAYNGSSTDGQLSSGATVLIQQDGGSNNAQAQLVFQPRTGYAYNRIVSSGGSAPFMTFCINNSEAMRIDASGNVGIGMDPDGSDAKLQVSGKISSDWQVGVGADTPQGGPPGARLHNQGSVYAYREVGDVSVWRGFGDGDVTSKIQSNGDATFSGTVYANGSPLTRTVDLIKTLSTLRKATMDETQDIRESLRSAIDELVEGFEQQIATMPAGDSE